MKNKTNVNEINIDLQEMLHKSEYTARKQGTIPIFLIWTIYGKGVLVNKNAEEYLLNEKQFAIPVKVDDKNLVYNANASDADWLLFPKIPQGIDEKSYIIPVDVESIVKYGQIFSKTFSPDEIHIGKALKFTKDICDLVLPKIRWKVTKPSMVCRDMKYSLGKEYIYNGNISLHKRGFHYATDPMFLFTWYRKFNPENEVYIVQVGEGIEDDAGVGVTNNIYFLKRINWKGLLP